MVIREYKTEDRKQVIDLWKRCSLIAPQNHPVRDIERKLQVDPDLFLVGVVDDTVIASVMAGYEGHRGWINYLAVHPDYQRNGYGAQLMHHAERLLKNRGCPKINLQVRANNSAVIAFYKKIGFMEDGVISLGKRLLDDDPFQE